MAYKRGLLVFVFLLSAYSVYYFTANQEGPGAIHKMKRSLVCSIPILSIAPSDGLTTTTDDGLNGRRVTSRSY